MSRHRLRLAALAVVVVGALVAASVAVASNFTAPVLKSPGKNAYVNPGKITLRVYSPGLTGSSRPVFVAINRTRKLKQGYLDGTCNVAKGCDFVSLHPWKGHAGWWTVTSSFNFPGYWAVTKGKYYWQADHTAAPSQCGTVRGCEDASAIHVFHVK